MQRAQAPALHEQERRVGDAFMLCVAPAGYNLVDMPDCSHRGDGRKHPDLKYEDDAGNQVVMECTRLMPPDVRRLEASIKRNVVAHITRTVPGTYCLECVVDPIGRGCVSAAIAAQVVSEINGLVLSGVLGETHYLSGAFCFRNVVEDGNRIVPWLVADPLPLDLRLDDPMAIVLQGVFHRGVSEAEAKFEGYTGTRVLLFSTGQSGLDIDFHAERFRDGQGLMLTWAEIEMEGVKNIDYIYLDPESSLKSADTGMNVFTGHRYVDRPGAWFKKLWQRRGIDSLLG